MSEKTERVEIWSLDPLRKVYDATLYVGEGGLPCVRGEDALGGYDYAIRWFPANWMLLPPKNVPAGILLSAWRTIETTMNEVKAWAKEE